MIYGANSIKLEFSINGSEKGQNLAQSKIFSTKLDSSDIADELTVADQFEAIF